MKTVTVIQMEMKEIEHELELLTVVYMSSDMDQNERNVLSTALQNEWTALNKQLKGVK